MQLGQVYNVKEVELKLQINHLASSFVSLCKFHKKLQYLQRDSVHFWTKPCR